MDYPTCKTADCSIFLVQVVCLYKRALKYICQHYRIAAYGGKVTIVN